MFDQTTGRSRCFGFLTFQDPAVIDTVLSRIHVLDKKQIDPKRASQRHQNTNVFLNQSSQRNYSLPSKIFIGGLHMDATEELISSILTERYGPVLEVSLMRDRESGRFRGFGFVSFTEPRSALLACTEGSITILGRRVDIKEATRRQNQQQQQLPLSQIQLPPTISRTPPTTYAPPNDDLSPEDQAKQEEAWKDYYEKNPEYYYQMIKIYSDPVLLKEYLAQYYGNSFDSISSDVSTNVGASNCSDNTTRVNKSSTAENTSKTSNEIDDRDEKLQSSSFNNRHHRQDDNPKEYNSRYNIERRYREYYDEQRRYDGRYDSGREDRRIGRFDRNDRYNDRGSRYNNDYRRNDRYRSSRSRSPSSAPAPHSPPIPHKSHNEEDEHEEQRQYGGGRRVRVARY